MNWNSRITLAVSNFFKNHGTKIIMITFIWITLIIINQVLKANPEKKADTNTYNPDVPIMDDNGEVPTKYRDTVKELIDNYFTYCTSNRISEAYELLTDDCKEYIYDNNEKIFEDYVINQFAQKETYYIQNFSNLNDTYIYDFYAIDDIESTGGTGGYSEYKDKIAVIKIGDNFKLSNQSYIGREQTDIKAEENNLSIKINYIDRTYRRESYNVTITNRSTKYILISDGFYNDAVTLNLGDQRRNATNTSNATFYLEPNTTKNFNFIFNKFADDHKTPTELNFNDIAVFNKYSSNSTVEQAEKLYSLNIKLK